MVAGFSFLFPWGGRLPSPLEVSFQADGSSEDGEVAGDHLGRNDFGRWYITCLSICRLKVTAPKVI